MGRYLAALVALGLAGLQSALADNCSLPFVQGCCQATVAYNCSLPSLKSFREGQYAGIRVNYLSFGTSTSSPNMPVRAREFEACTGVEIVFSEAANVWEDPIKDLGTQEQRGLGIYDGYLMSYSHFPEASALNLAERLDTRLSASNKDLQWETVFPKVRMMGQYRRNGENQLDFLMYDGDFFVPLLRLDLLEANSIPVPNTWEEVLAIAKRFHKTDLNGDGTPDFGFCHFPREGAGFWDWWWAEEVYATWATYAQTKDSTDGFFFDARTMQPQVDTPGFRKAVSLWKELWVLGGEGCITDNFITGRCAIGFSPPGCWKKVFHLGMARKNSTGHVVWRPTMRDGSYAEPFHIRPFGSLQVEDPAAGGQLRDCTAALCPLAKPVPPHGHHVHQGGSDRASVLPPSPHQGKLINRAPFYWSGGLGTIIRKSASPQKKDAIWDFFVYTNSAATSAYDVAAYSSWLDSWRTTILTEDGTYFLAAGWSATAYQEHRTIMDWALGTESNGALNLRLPGAKQYTYDVLGTEMASFVAGNSSLDLLVQRVSAGWAAITDQRGLLHQLRIYRAALGLDELPDVDMCSLHRAPMDAEDPSVCRKFDADNNKVYLVLLVVFLGGFGLLVLITIVWWVARMAIAKRRMDREKELQTEATVQAGLNTVKELGHPMVVMNAVTFLKLTWEQLGKLHEGARDMGFLRVLDTMETIQLFRDQGNYIIFFSYQWLSWGRAGPDVKQNEAMRHALTLYQSRAGVPLERVHVWLDILSIPQHHAGLKVLAVNSLYVYASSVDVLIIIAPESQHEDTGETAGLESYKSRVWTRVEQIAHCSVHGLETILIYDERGLKEVSEDWMRDVVRIFDAQMTCCRRKHDDHSRCDRESLVLPLLGLWFRVAAAESRGIKQTSGSRILFELMQGQRDLVFPRYFDFVKQVGDKEVVTRRPLFGDLLERVDKHVAQQLESKLTAMLTVAAKPGKPGHRTTPITVTVVKCESSSTTNGGNGPWPPTASEREVVSWHVDDVSPPMWRMQPAEDEELEGEEEKQQLPRRL